MVLANQKYVFSKQETLKIKLFLTVKYTYSALISAVANDFGWYLEHIK